MADMQYMMLAKNRAKQSNFSFCSHTCKFHVPNTAAFYSVQEICTTEKLHKKA